MSDSKEILFKKSSAATSINLISLVISLSSLGYLLWGNNRSYNLFCVIGILVGSFLFYFAQIILKLTPTILRSEFQKNESRTLEYTSKNQSIILDAEGFKFTRKLTGALYGYHDRNGYYILPWSQIKAFEVLPRAPLARINNHPKYKISVKGALTAIYIKRDSFRGEEDQLITHLRKLCPVDIKLFDRLW